jgi:hypothetical protein
VIAAAVLGLLSVNAISGCHSHHIEATIENHTGGAVTLLEVDYPSASFGADTLAADGVFRHRIQTRGSGPISVQYTAEHGSAVQITGPTLLEQQEGSIDIVLLPNGQAEFHPSLNPRH